MARPWDDSQDQGDEPPWPHRGIPASKGIAEQILELLTIAPDQGQLRAVAKEDTVIAVEPRLEFADAVDLHHGRTMDAHELGRIEPPFQPVHRLTQQVGL